MGRLRIKEILNKTVDYFKKHDLDSPRLDAEVLLADLLGIKRVNLYVEFNRPLTAEEVDNYRELIIKRTKGFPVAYLVGKKEFMSLDFKVTPEVLIPRPETEHLVETALERIEVRSESELTVVDVGTGSGAIIISIVKLADTKIKGLATDISEPALKLAGENAEHHQVGAEIEFRTGDLLEPIEEKPDLIVSNPPYIPSQKLEKLSEEVQKQPELALDGGQDGLDYYRRLVKQASNLLADNGELILEVGYQQAEDVVKLLKDNGFYDLNTKTDYADIERIVTAKK